MGLIGAINWKNTAENIVLFVTGALVGAFITFKVYRATSNDILTQLTPVVEKAIDKETIANDIVNKIEVKVDKIKKSDSINININQQPTNNQKPENLIIKNEKPKDSVRKGFFGRLVSKEKYKKVE